MAGAEGLVEPGQRIVVADVFLFALDELAEILDLGFGGGAGGGAFQRFSQS